MMVIKWLLKQGKATVRYCIALVIAMLLFNLIMWIYNVTDYNHQLIEQDTNTNDNLSDRILHSFKRALIVILCYISECNAKDRPECLLPTPAGLQLITFEKPEFHEISLHLPDIKYGGSWSPPDCKSPHPGIAVVVPYRDREDHLKIFLNYIHRFLQKQMVPYTVYVIEQGPGSQFNRGMLLNIGYIESQQDCDGLDINDINVIPPKYSCVVFHDVDLLPEDDRNLYTCTEGSVRHLSAHVDEFAYRLPYPELVGGAITFWRSDFRSINGFSNKFFGWGGEDDDLYNRIRYHGLNITRYTKEIARYKMIRHRKIYPNKNRFKYLQTGDRRFLTDGLNNIKFVKLRQEKTPLYTWIYVQLDETNIRDTVKLHLRKSL